MEFYHEPVMAQKCIDLLCVKDDGIYVDGTTGGGGHALLIAQRLKGGRLLCIDKDIEALNSSAEKLKGFNNITYVNDDFKNIPQILANNGISFADGIMLDLGISSYQVDCDRRGFSYMKDAVLDMRMDRTSCLSAYNVINEYSLEELKNIFYKYGEEKFSKRIAREIVKRREDKLIQTTFDLVSIIDKAIPAAAKKKGSHPAKRVFQAVRIEVNAELTGLFDFIKELPLVLNDKARIVVLTFNSLEDRIIKHAFYEMQNPCVCPSGFPVCVCGLKSQGTIVFKKPIVACADEIERNRRSKSAKLRAFERHNS